MIGKLDTVSQLDENVPLVPFEPPAKRQKVGGEHISAHVLIRVGVDAHAAKWHAWDNDHSWQLADATLTGHVAYASSW